MRSVAILGALSLSGCFEPSLAGFDCGLNATCPVGFFCDLSSNRCVVEVEPDGAPIDAVEGELSNGVTPDDAVGADPVAIDNNALFDSDSGAVTVGGALVRDPGEGLAGGVRFTARDGYGVFGFESLVVGSASSVRVVGTRPVIFVATDLIEVGGVIDVGGGFCVGAQERRCGGPGGGDGGTDAALAVGCGPGGGGAANGDLGGGGGAYGSAGGSGGDELDEMMFPGGEAGDPTNCVVSLTPLVGGSGGGHGGGASSPNGDGGGGGGAIQLASFASIAIDGAVTAPGEGGAPSVAANGGGGGGSGGAILIEAPLVRITGAVTANGGGGGTGDASDPGERGRLDLTPAAGGAAPGGSAGGDGAAAEVEATSGAPANSDTGGGGGGVGLIRVNAESFSNTGLVSPNPL